MARKRTKIKRYGNIYGRGMGSGSWLILVAMIFGVLLFGVIGWSLYTPVHEFVMKLGEDQQPEPISSSSLTPLPESSAQPLTQQESSVAEPVEESNPSETVIAEYAMRGIYLPTLQLLDETVFTNQLTNATEARINTVVVDAKDATGTVLFTSEIELAKMAGATNDTAYIAKNVAKKIKSQGLIPAARVHAFRDSTTPLNARNMAVHYYDSDIYWYDNSPSMGGKPWLNPYSQEAQQYIVSLVEELCSQGFEIILLDSVQFPSGVGLDKAGYGADAKSLTKAEVLNQFVKKVSDAVKAKGGELIVCMQDDWIPADDETKNEFITNNNNSLYGENPTAFFTNRVTLDLPSDFSLWKSIISRAKASADWIGLIPAYSADGALTDCPTLISSLADANVNEYILYNPQGNYKLK